MRLNIAKIIYLLFCRAFLKKVIVEVREVKSVVFIFPRANSQRKINSVQFSSVAQSCLTLCDPMNCSMPGNSAPVPYWLGQGDIN